MSPREQRLQRKKWRDNSKRYQAKKNNQKKIQEVIILQEKTVKTIVDNKSDPLHVPNIKVEYKKKTDKVLLAKIKNLKRKHAEEKKEMLGIIKRYQYRCRCLMKKIKSMLLNREEANNDKKEANEASEAKYKLKTVHRRKKSDFRKEFLHWRLKKIILGGKNIQTLVEQFYEDDINSRITAGKKQCIKNKKHGIKKQKRYLLDSIKNLHKKFLEEHTNIRISYVTFSRLRPFWVYLPRDDRDTCGCTVHTNMGLLISALKKKRIVDITNFQTMLDALCCDKYNLKCVSRKCDNCKDKVIPYKEFCNLQQIEYNEWNRGEKESRSKRNNDHKENQKNNYPKGFDTQTRAVPT